MVSVYFAVRLRGCGCVLKMVGKMILIAIVSCKEHAAYRKAIRETWLPSAHKENVDTFFFMGRGSESAGLDEVVLDCGDGYGELPDKVREIIRWAVVRGYTYILKIDNDTILNVPRFLRSGFDSRDFSGHTNDDGADPEIPWGFCYTLSKRAMEILANAPLPVDSNNDEAWVANTLSPHGIVLYDEQGFFLYRGKRSEYVPTTARPLRTPPRHRPPDQLAPPDCIACCIYINWWGYRATPDSVSLKEYYKMYRELTQNG